MPKAAYIQQDYLTPEERAELAAELARRGYTIHEFRAHPPDIDSLPLTPDVFVLAALWVKLRLLERAQLTHRIAPDYPAALRNFLRRKVWTGSLEDLLHGPAQAQRPIFVKVGSVSRRTHADAFESQLVESLEVLHAAPWIRPETPVLCSEPTAWIAEWRVYVCHSEIVEEVLYLPEMESIDEIRPEMLLDFEVAGTAVRRLAEAREEVAGYALDFGVQATGEIELIEMNDALALANYSLMPEQYMNVHLARWNELIMQIPEGGQDRPIR
jgi:hypothetical protein